MQQPAPRTLRLVVAVAASAALVAAAPWVGVLRSQIRAAFPGQFSLIINGIAGTALLAGVVWGLSRIRTDRWRRYGALVMAIAIATVYDRITASADPAISSVERFHFVEYGLITFLFYRVWHERGGAAALVVPAIVALIVGMAEETYQWFLPARVGELKDVFLNAVAISCGMIFSTAITPPADGIRGTGESSLRLVGKTLALAILALAAFVHLVHLGVRVSTAAGASFVSYYTTQELDSLNRERASIWTTAPPLIRPDRLSREDQFATEGLQHIQARNKAWATGDIRTAWHENLILERHYPAMLDTPSYVSKTGHRWSPEQRADGETRLAASSSEPFISHAYPYPLYTWSPWVVWAGAVILAGTCYPALPWLITGWRSRSWSSRRS